GGMRQRVALARSLVLEPDVLLMDEQFAALDAQTQQKLAAELEALWRQLKMTVVFVTHHVANGVQLADRVIVFGTHPGRIIAEYGVDLPRPRRLDDPALLHLTERITERFSTAQRVQEAMEELHAH
ncbi:MAG: ABC transporter ATP-binding protein, partial [Myxococcales bacterium]